MPKAEFDLFFEVMLLLSFLTFIEQQAINYIEEKLCKLLGYIQSMRISARGHVQNYRLQAKYETPFIINLSLNNPQTFVTYY